MTSLSSWINNFYIYIYMHITRVGNLLFGFSSESQILSFFCEQKSYSILSKEQIPILLFFREWRERITRSLFWKELWEGIAIGHKKRGKTVNSWEKHGENYSTIIFEQIAYFLRAKEQITSKSLMLLFFKERWEWFALVTLL